MHGIMKKTIFAAAAIAALALVSCSKENGADNISTANFTFKASIETPTPEAKAGLFADGKSLEWKIGDEVTLYFQNTETPGTVVTATATVSSVDGTGVATFSANIPEDADKSEIVATYNPADGATATDLHPFIVKDNAPHTRHRINIQAIQNAVKDNYDSSAMPLVAHWKGTAGDPFTLLFKNTTSLLAIGLTNNSGKTIESIKISNTSAYLSGYFYYLAADREGFSWKVSKDNTKEITLIGEFANGKYYFIAPGQDADLSGLKITFSASDATAEFTNPNSLSVSRNNIYNIGEFTLTADDFVAPTVKGIAFSDTKVNMDDTFYAKLVAQCTGTASPYTLNKTVEIDNITLIPNSGTPKTMQVNIGEKSYLTKKSSIQFASASAGDAELVLYCMIINGRSLGLTWTDKEGVGKTVPQDVLAAINNTTSSKQYYDSDETALHLLLPGVKEGDVIKISILGSDSHRINKFLWKAAPTKE